MSETARTVVVCSCDDTMPLDAAAIARACGGAVKTGTQLCRRELDLTRMLMQAGGPMTMACTQEEPLFRETAADLGRADDIAFVNIREQAGWSDEAAKAGPKMAALLAAAAEPMPATPLVTMESEGVTLVLGRDGTALAAAGRLADRLDLTVVLTHPGEATPPRVTDFPVLAGRVRNAKGWLGAFEVTLDGVAQPLPSSRDAFRFGPARDGAVSRCDIILDLTGGQPLFPPTSCAPATCAPIRATLPPSSALCSTPATSSARSTSRATSNSRRRSAPIRAQRSPAAPAVSTSARLARSPRRATMSPSTRISAPAAGPAPPPAPPAPPPTRCRRSTPACAACARCSLPIARREALRRSSRP